LVDGRSEGHAGQLLAYRGETSSFDPNAMQRFVCAQPGRQPSMPGPVIAERVGGHQPAGRVDDRGHVVILVGIDPADVADDDLRAQTLLHASSCARR
jgi:hypothetical protein